MIELVNNFITGTNQTELETLQALLAEFNPEFTFAITANEVPEGAVATYTLLVEIQNLANASDMSSFLEFLSAKIEQVNQQP